MIEKDQDRGPSPSEVLRARLDDWAIEHAAKSNGRLIAYEREDPNYPKKRRTHVRGNPLDHEIVDIFAAKAEPAYRILRADVATAERDTHMVSAMAEIIHRGDNVALVFDHEDLINLAIGQAAVYSEMDKMGKPANLETAIIINTMIERLGVRLDGDEGDEAEEDTEPIYAPAIDSLKIGEDHIFLSFPKTDSGRKHMRRGGIISDATETRVRGMINRHNTGMRLGVRKQLNRGGTLLSVSASGSTDRPDSEDPFLINMAKVGKGTADLLAHDKTYIMPVACSYGDGREPYLIFPTAPQFLDDPHDIHNVMALIAETKNEHSAGSGFRYQYSHPDFT